MKKPIFLLLLITISFLSIAQNGYISLSMGGTIPVGDFESTADASTTGYAGSGFTLNIEGKYSFKPILGIGGTLNYGMNSTDEDALEEDWLEYVKNLYPDSNIPDDANIQFTTNAWNYVNLMAGPVLSIPVSRLLFEFKAQAGVSFITPPKRELYITYDNDNNEMYHNSSGHNTTFGYLLGACILFQANEDYGIKLGADYFGSKAKLTIESQVDDGMGGTEPHYDLWEVPVTAFHVTVGIAYFF